MPHNLPVGLTRQNQGPTKTERNSNVENLLFKINLRQYLTIDKFRKKKEKKKYFVKILKQGPGVNSKCFWGYNESALGFKLYCTRGQFNKINIAVIFFMSPLT